MATLGLDASQPLNILPLPTTAFFFTPARWSPDGKALTFIDNRSGASNIWAQPLKGGPPKPVTSFTTDQIYDFAWSRTGDLAVARGTETSDVVLISNLQ